MRVVCPPTFERSDYYTNHGIFLAGSIEMGKAERWQDKVIAALSDLEGTIYNPRRPDWDNSIENSMHDNRFREQVYWEISHLSTCSIAVFYFDPTTTSPISMMELGLVLGRDSFDKLIVCCPDGFWKKGNIDTTLQCFQDAYIGLNSNRTVQADNLDELIAAVRLAVAEL